MTFRVAGLVDSTRYAVPSERGSTYPRSAVENRVGLYLCAIGIHYATTMDFFISAVLGWVGFRLQLSASLLLTGNLLATF